jgi:DNA primase
LLVPAVPVNNPAFSVVYPRYGASPLAGSILKFAVPDFAQTVKQQADIVKVIGGYIRLRKAGAQNYSGLCPFHKEKSPSFSVHAGRQFYHCFGCGQSGDIFSFVSKIENLSFPEAVRAVAQKCGIPLPKREYNSPEEAAEAGIRRKLLDLHEIATVWFEEQLRSPEGALAREYLSGRGVTADAIRTFRIGYAPDNYNSLRDFLAQKFDTETLRASGVVGSKDSEDEGGNVVQGRLYALFRKRIMFPICNESGRVIAFTGRSVETSGKPTGEKSGPKYYNSPATPLYTKGHVLFNLDKAKAQMRAMEFALLVEGQMDCISVFMRGIQNVIATSGTAFTEQQVGLLRRQTSNAVVLFDPDGAGAGATEKTIDLLTDFEFRIKIVQVKDLDGLDPDRFVRERGIAQFAALIREARPRAYFLTMRARQLFPGTSSAQKMEAMNYLLPFIKRIRAPLERLEFVNDAAQKLGIDSVVLHEELRQAALKRQDHIESKADSRAASLLPFEKFFIEAACNDQKSPQEYAELHAELRNFDRRMPVGWQELVLQNLPPYLFERLTDRPQGQDIENTGETEEQRILLRKVFLEAGDHTRSHAQDMEIVRDLEIQALRREISVKRAALDSATDRNSGENIQLSQEILQLERKLRELECD